MWTTEVKVVEGWVPGRSLEVIESELKQLYTEGWRVRVGCNDVIILERDLYVNKPLVADGQRLI